MKGRTTCGTLFERAVTIMSSNAFETIRSLVRQQTSVRKGMAVLLNLCNKEKPSPVWKQLLHLNYEGDSRQLAGRFVDLLADEPPPTDINGLWFGLSDIRFPRDGRTTYFLYLVGSKRFDPQQCPASWASGPEYRPGDRSWPSGVLDTICRLTKQEESISELGQYIPVLGYACLIVAEWCRGPMRKKLLGESSLRGVAVGFNGGDNVLVDVLRRDDPLTLTQEEIDRNGMDEARWLALDDPQQLLEFMKGRANDRKLRLFAVACCRRISRLLKDQRLLTGIEVAERSADGLSAEGEIEAAYKSAGQALRNYDEPEAEDYAALAAADLTFPIADRLFRAVSGVSSSALSAVACDRSFDWFTDAREIEARQQASMLRDIFGSPFRPVSLDRRWRTGTVVALAQAIYEERAFDRMGILGDALEEAGCDDKYILSLCRTDEPHAKGCWLVDLILGKG